MIMPIFSVIYLALLLYPSIHINFGYVISAYFASAIFVACPFWLCKSVSSLSYDRVALAVICFSLLLATCGYYLHSCHRMFLHNAIKYFINSPVISIYVFTAILLFPIFMLAEKYKTQDYIIDMGLTTFALAISLVFLYVPILIF
jgi:ABC-type spermidine/putrescine transport system permease subunit II